MYIANDAGEAEIAGINHRSNRQFLVLSHQGSRKRDEAYGQQKCERDAQMYPIGSDDPMHLHVMPVPQDSEHDVAYEK
jgi:hypothetical protein